MPSVLFVCFANQFRSPVAAAFFRERLEEAGLEREWRVQSAGTWARGTGVMPPGLLRGLQQIGIHLEGHHPRPVSTELLAAQDLILVMERGQQEALEAEFPQVRGRVCLLSEVGDGLAYDIPDPAKHPSYSYPEAARDLQGLVGRGFSEICRRAASTPSGR